MENKSNFMILSVVAIVAIVALVMLVQTPQQQSLSSDDMVGMPTGPVQYAGRATTVGSSYYIRSGAGYSEMDAETDARAFEDFKKKCRARGGLVRNGECITLGEYNEETGLWSLNAEEFVPPSATK